ncbi:MaoC family dehydratase [Chloroflexota bacterium]
MQGKFFDELEVGDQFTSHRRTLTETDVVNFICITGLTNPLFTDEEFAREKGFGTLVVPGPLCLSIALGLTDELVYGTITAVLAIDNVRFIAPVKPGDTIWVKTRIINKRESKSRPDRGPISLRHEISNQKSEQVCSFERTLMFLKRG